MARKDVDYPRVSIGRGFNKTYLKAENFYAGDFRRFISLGAPFRGSALAERAETVLRRQRDVRVARDALDDPAGLLDSVVRMLDGQQQHGLVVSRYYTVPMAFIDLQPNSDIEQWIAQANFPTNFRRVRWNPVICIASQDLSQQGLQFWRATVWDGVFGIGDALLGGIGELNAQSSDLIVKVVSQIIGQSESIGFKLGNHIHASADAVNQQLGTAFEDETSSMLIANEVRRLLSTDSSADWQGELNP